MKSFYVHKDDLCRCRCRCNVDVLFIVNTNPLIFAVNKCINKLEVERQKERYSVIPDVSSAFKKLRRRILSSLTGFGNCPVHVKPTVLIRTFKF
jgi:hypothetical protein